MVTAVRIGPRLVGPGHPCFVIAEAGVNHNGDVDLAIKLINAALEAGADAVKFQTFKAERLVSPTAPKAQYQLKTTDRGESQFEMIRRLELSEEDHEILQEHCRHREIVFLSSPFDELCADYLETLGVEAFKIPSGEITNHPFLAHVARKGRPILLSTGMADMQEVEAAVGVIRKAGEPGLILLQCVSNYPADPMDVNLRAMRTMAEAFDLPVGYSDHVPGNEVAFAAVVLGACVIEKHFTLDRNLPGPDHQASLEPSELAQLIQGIRTIERSLGDGIKRPAESEANTAAVARKSLVARRAIAAGTELTPDDLIAKRPGTGIPPSRLGELIGRRTRREFLENEQINEDALE